MKLVQDLFSTDYGLMSIIGLGIILAMGGFYVSYFLRKMHEAEQQQSRN